MPYDIIGDIHGHVEPLRALLTKLGYCERAGAWRHAERTAVFVGDFIDRGPGQLEVLQLVRRMVDGGSALAVMGNHEFNAVAFATPDPAPGGGHLRPRNEKNRHQHQAFLTELGIDSALHMEWVNWFLQLPLWIETPDFRVVHACWHEPSVSLLKPLLMADQRLDLDLVEAASRRGSPIYAAVETLLKGREVTLPAGVSFKDKDGHERYEIRIKWWAADARTYRDAYMGPAGVEMPDVPIEDLDDVKSPDRPTFIGHYWLDVARDGLGPRSAKVACVDYSVAKGGPLVAYRYDGEPELLPNNFFASAC